MRDRIAQRDQETEADTDEKHRPLPEQADEGAYRRDLVVLVCEEARLVGFTLSKQVEGEDVKVLAISASR